jgi:hypothetical protein
VNLNKMDNWENQVDNINWESMLEEIDQALVDNLAAELGFPSYDHLEQASELVVDDYYICHLSDGRWVWWNPYEYATKDPEYFADKKEIMYFIADFLQLDEDKMQQLQEGLDQVVQTKRCVHCDFEFDPSDQNRQNWVKDESHEAYCSLQCVQEAAVKEDVKR